MKVKNCGILVWWSSAVGGLGPNHFFIIHVTVFKLEEVTSQLVNLENFSLNFPSSLFATVSIFSIRNHHRSFMVYYYLWCLPILVKFWFCPWYLKITWLGFFNLRLIFRCLLHNNLFLIMYLRRYVCTFVLLKVLYDDLYSLCVPSLTVTRNIRYVPYRHL